MYKLQGINIDLYLYMYAHKIQKLWAVVLNVLNTKDIPLPQNLCTVLQIWFLRDERNECFFMTENICKNYIFHNHFPVNYSA